MEENYYLYYYYKVRIIKLIDKDFTFNYIKLNYCFIILFSFIINKIIITNYHIIYS
jgi:hypothetical protein